MKNLLICLLILSGQQSWSVNVVTRNEKMELVKKDVTDLQMDPTGNFFQNVSILESTSETQKPYTEMSPTEQLKVATLAYHAQKAEQYFKTHFNNDYTQSINNMIIRYNIARTFNVGRHFSKKDENYNNAVTINPSNEYALTSQGVKEWPREIWFRPAQKIPNSGKMNLAALPPNMLQKSALMALDMSFRKYAQTTVVTESLTAFNLSDQLFQVGLLMLLQNATPLVVGGAMTLFQGDYYLETAMIPEVIYHEVAHLFLADHLPTSGSYPINEAMANYFAAVISGNTSLTQKLGDYGSNVDSTGLSKKKYSSSIEQSAAAHDPFTYTYLWKIRTRVSKQIKIPGMDSASFFDQVVYESRKHIVLDADKTVAMSLPEALKNSVQELAQKLNLPSSVASAIRVVIAQEAHLNGM